MTTFGEIVEPVSRTTWEDWDEDNTDTNFTMLQWKLPLEIPDTIETLFILEGKFLSDSIKVQSKDYLKMINSIPEANLYLYKIKSLNKYICTVRDYSLLLSSELVDLLRLFICKSNDVVTIQTKPLIEYQTTNISTQPMVIRKLTTSRSSNNSWDFHFPKLEQPNILSGVAAGAVCIREHTNLPATALVYYIEHIEEYQTDEIFKLLEKLCIVQNCTPNSSNILSSNLYI